MSGDVQPRKRKDKKRKKGKFQSEVFLDSLISEIPIFNDKDFNRLVFAYSFLDDATEQSFTQPPIISSATVNEDVNIHIHKEEGTGGGICAKIVFFLLFSALAVLVGLIITEHRGLTDCKF